jgi:hypothetical protein
MAWPLGSELLSDSLSCSSAILAKPLCARRDYRAGRARYCGRRRDVAAAIPCDRRFWLLSFGQHFQTYCLLCHRSPLSGCDARRAPRIGIVAANRKRCRRGGGLDSNPRERSAGARAAGSHAHRNSSLRQSWRPSCRAHSRQRSCRCRLGRWSRRGAPGGKVLADSRSGKCTTRACAGGLPCRSFLPLSRRRSPRCGRGRGLHFRRSYFCNAFQGGFWPSAGTGKVG